MNEDHIIWLFSHVILALLPFFLTLILIYVGGIKITWINLLKQGELFFFSSTISASSISNLFIQNSHNQISQFIIGCILLIILMVSTGMAALRRFMDLQEDIENPIDNQVFSTFSIVCTMLAILLSYISLKNY